MARRRLTGAPGTLSVQPSDDAGVAVPISATASSPEDALFNLMAQLFDDSVTQLRQAAVRRGPRKRTLALMEEVRAVLDEFDGSMSTRQIYYQLVSRGAVQNRSTEYDRVQRLLVTMRRDGAIAYDRIVDRTRSKHQRAGWDGVEDVMNAVIGQYRRNLWSDQDTVPMICCEKQALEGIFAEVVDEYGASLWVIRGYNSESFAYEWAEEIKRQMNRGKRVAITYFGDFDPSGLSIEQDCQAKLARHGAEFEWSRRGLLLEDFDRFELVNVDVKSGDSRSKGYLEKYGNRAAELDALRPDELRTRIRAAIEQHINKAAWKRMKRTEIAEKESLSAVTSNWDIALAAVNAG